MARTKQTARKAVEPFYDEEDDADCCEDEVEDEGGSEDEDQEIKITADQAALTKGPMQSELKLLDYKCSEKGTWYYGETVEEEEIPEQVNWWDMYALCLIRHMSGKCVSHVSLRINSPHLKEILREVIGSYPGISFHTNNITIQAPYHVLYHYHKQLRAQMGTVEKDSDKARHLQLLLDFIQEQFGETISESENLQEKKLISYDLLWTIFGPGLTLTASVDGQPRAYKLNDYAYQYHPCRKLNVNTTFVDYDGESFGTRSETISIRAYSGAESIASLEIFPMHFHTDEEELRSELITRGKRFEQLGGMSFRQYDGIAFNVKSGRFSHSGRVVVDTKTFHRINANLAFTVFPLPGHNKEEPRTKRQRLEDENSGATPMVIVNPPLTDEQLLMASATVRGFSFAEKRWFDFFVEDLSDIKWNANCFDQLVLPDAQKGTVKALVSTHVEESHGFDDIVQGKGQGLILVLHGPPGVGKTLTAETVAEFCQRPLYSVSSGDLGLTTQSLDAKLERILDLASTWKAVLLIDEADVFLERRSLHDLERNGLVSIFLRVLEYYKGILFLTSNRVSTFDDAFKSRIHVPLRYNDLTVESRKQIWKNFLAKVDGGVQIEEKEYDRLAQAHLNGRQIKNVIRTAKSLGQYHGEKLDAQKLQQVVDIQQEFEDELEAMNAPRRGNGVLTPDQ